MLDVLLVEDDADVRASVASALVEAGHGVTEASDGAQAVGLLASHSFDLAICDVQMPGIDGLTLFRRIRREAPGTAVIIMTSYGEIPDVIASLRDGAADYVTKPFDPDDFALRVVAHIAAHRALRRNFEAARAEFVDRATRATLVARSPSMRSVADRVALLAHSHASVVVTGDRGTGKELVARTLHAQGPRRDGPIVLVDGARLPEVLIASEQEEVRDPERPADAWIRDGVGGTVVLHGIDGLSQRMQARLVCVISSSAVMARQDARGRPCGVRLVTVSREPLGDRVARGELLESLYYRLNGTTVHVPRLAERGQDLCPLVAQLLRELQPAGRTVPALSVAAWKMLSTYGYPGNVRELRWALEHALAMADGGPIDLEHLPVEVKG